ncbi:MAG: DUF4394 domain-containing protein [Longimicrobiales bacterium]
MAKARRFSPGGLVLRASLALSMLSCGESDGPIAPAIDGVAIFGVTLDNRLVLFGSAAPGTIVSEMPISGLPAGRRIVSIDFRPSDGQLYGAGTDNRLYRINVNTAIAAGVGSGFTTALEGTHFGFAFDPVADRIRTSSAEGDQNFRLNPTDGTLTATDSDFAFSAGDPNLGDAPALAALAYTNSVAGAGSTVLYGIDSGNDVLVTLTNPNSGVLRTVGGLGFNTVPCASLDIDARDGRAWATLADNGTTRLYSIDLATGRATLVGVVDVDSEVQGLAIRP